MCSVRNSRLTNKNAFDNMTNPIFTSLFIYGLIALLFYIIGNGYSSANHNQLYVTRTHSVGVLFYVVLFFVIFSGLRENTGSDTVGYVEQYNLFSRNETYMYDHYEMGWHYFTRFFVMMGAPSWFYLSFIAFIQISSLLFLIRKFPVVTPYVLLLIIISGEFLNMWNGLRQEMVSYICIGLVVIMNRGGLKLFLLYVIFVYILAFFHKSALVLLILWPLFRTGKIIPLNKYLILGIWIVCSILGEQKLWITNLNALEIIAPYFGYEFDVDATMGWINSFDEQNAGFRTIAKYIVDFVLIFYGVEFAKKEGVNKYIAFFYNTFIIFILVSPLFNGARMFLRLLMYLQPYYLIFSAFVVMDLVKSKERIRIYAAYTVLILNVLMLVAAVLTSNINSGAIYNTIIACK